MEFQSEKDYFLAYLPASDRRRDTTKDKRRRELLQAPSLLRTISKCPRLLSLELQGHYSAQTLSPTAEIQLLCLEVVQTFSTIAQINPRAPSFRSLSRKNIKKRKKEIVPSFSDDKPWTWIPPRAARSSNTTKIAKSSNQSS